MEQDESDLEEGEVLDDPIINYTKLERPANYSLSQPSQRFPETGQYSDSEDGNIISSESDSDSDSGIKSKKPKIKLKPKPILQRHPKRKTYDIWSTRAQEDALAETLNSCDVTTKDRSRDVETYDSSIGRKFYEELEAKTNNKRTRDDRNNAHFRPRKRGNSREKNIKKGSSRKVPDLEVDISNSADEIAREIANKLCEEREDLILKVIETMGKEKTFEYYRETQKVENEGGMPIMNQTRRRTPGGVFLFLVRNDYHITYEQKATIFHLNKDKQKELAKEKKKMKSQHLKNQVAAAKAKLLPELLTRAEQLAKQNPTRQLKKTDDRQVINPPPSPETDHHSESEMASDVKSVRGEKVEAYEDGLFDIGCADEMDLF